MKHIGKELNQIIGEKRLIKKDIAEKIGITPEYFSQIMRKSSIDCELLERICKVVNISPAYFFDDYDITKQNVVGNGNIAAINSNVDTPAGHEIELLKRILDEKERTIQILLGDR